MTTVKSEDPAANVPSTSRSAMLVGAGILFSRVFGLIRLRVFSHYFGLQSEAADAFNAAFRIPNILQNLFGEGVLSASFIPVYAALLARHDQEEADRVAGAIVALLALTMSLLVLLGVVASPVLIDLIAPGFEGAQRDLTIRLVRILFPSIGLLVLSAWCLGILNSHRKFFLSYAAPVAFNLAMIATLLIYGSRRDQYGLAAMLAWGAVAGSALQVGVQLPAVVRLAKHLLFSLDVRSTNVRTVARNFWPVFISRGVVQLSAYVDMLLASLLPTGAVTGLFNAQLLYTLPVSLFGMSVSAAELPAMASALGDAHTVAAHLRQRLNAGLRQIAFFIVPSAMGFLALGDVIAAALLQTGRFTHHDALYVWGILAGATIGLLASTLGRLYASTYYALRDTRTPLRYSIIRILLTTVLGYLCAIRLPPLLGIDPRWGVAGLTSSAGVAGWLELILLRRTLNRRIGPTGLAASFVIKLWCAAAVGGAIGWAIKLTLPPSHPVMAAVLILGPYGAVYFALTYWLGVPEMHAAIGRLRRYVSR